MSGMTDCSYKEGCVLDEDEKNDCEEKHRQDDGVLEHVYSNLSSLSKNLQLMYEEVLVINISCERRRCDD
jgi:hypothetical protein